MQFTTNHLVVNKTIYKGYIFLSPPEFHSISLINAKQPHTNTLRQSPLKCSATVFLLFANFGNIKTNLGSKEPLTCCCLAGECCKCCKDRQRHKLKLFIWLTGATCFFKRKTFFLKALCKCLCLEMRNHSWLNCSI